ncbi:MAG: secretin and TonB N-terminal domain-containing protein [Candidatus Sumerlaeia bacterium]|nr:secretin and TonB N-terminal domain-containing protein [Candidatus Sumerlaeia bacterium]
MQRNTLRRTATLAGAAILAAAALHAAPVIDGVQFSRDDSGERLFVRWSEATQVQVDRFPAANQVVLTFRGAGLSPAARAALEIPSASGVADARLSEVVLSDGASATQLTLTLKEGAGDLDTVASARALTLLLPGHAAAAPKAQGDGIVLTNRELVEMFGAEAVGSADAPSTGAGQDGSAAPAFFVPPPAAPAPTSIDVSGDDQSLLANDPRFREVIRNLDVKDAELLFVLRGFARQTQMNIIANPSVVGGRVSVSLQNVTVGDAFDALLKANDLAFKVERGGIIRIVRRDEVRTTEKETVTQAVPINWISADEVAKALKPFMTEEAGGISVAQIANTVIIREVPENMTRLQELIRRIDAPEKQVKMELRLVDLTESASRNLGFRTDFVSSEGQDLIPLGSGGSSPTEDPDVFFFPRSTGGAGGVPVDSSLDLTGRSQWDILGNNYQFEWNLRAEEQRGEATVLAHPVVVSLNNVEASIEIIRKEPYESATTTDAGVVVTIEEKDTGIRVRVLPRITNNGYVQMNIAPEQLIFRELRPTRLGNYPLIDERRVNTSVIVKDEETVALGGLRQLEFRSSERGAPWLMRLPVFGWLFKNTTDEMDKTELVLFATPRIIKKTALDAYETSLYDKIDYNWDLPDYYFDQVRPRTTENEKAGPVDYKKFE